jgi:hypothetical protein
MAAISVWWTGVPAGRDPQRVYVEGVDFFDLQIAHQGEPSCAEPIHTPVMPHVACWNNNESGGPFFSTSTFIELFGS